MGDALERSSGRSATRSASPGKRWRAFTRRTALTGGAAGLAARDRRLRRRRQRRLEQAQGGTPRQRHLRRARASCKFVFVNHVTTNPFFVPTRYGAEDACKLLGCSYQWTGSENANVNEMVNAFNSAISAKADGIAVCLVDQKAFNEPDRRGARRPRSRSSPTTPTSRQRAARLHRPGPVRLRPGDGQADRRASSP